MTNAYLLKVGARDLVVAELKCSEFLRCLQSVGGDTGSSSGQHDMAVALARSCIRKIDDRRVTYQDLLVEWSRLFPLARDVIPVFKALNNIHSPTRAEIAAFRASWQCQVEGSEERWTATLPSGRTVTMAPMGAQSLGDVLRAAENASVSSPGAKAFGGLLESLAKGIVAVDGKAVRTDTGGLDSLLQVKDANLLSTLFDEINGVSVEVGELKPVPGT